MEGLSVAGVEAGPDEETAEGLRAMRMNGVHILPDLLPPDLVARCAEAFARDYPGYLEGEAPDAFITGEKRFVAPVAIDGAFADPRLFAHPRMVALLDGLLGPRWVVEAFGVIVALPGAALQHDHRDGGQLFKETGLDRLLPPFACTFAMPLVPVDATSGRTAFWTGTHRFTDHMDREPDFVPDLAPGSGMIWDFRVVHQGQANLGTTPRPMLYLTYARHWWMDNDNFVRGRNAKLLVSRAMMDGADAVLKQRLERAEVRG
jgi:hypothetical protein